MNLPASPRSLSRSADFGLLRIDRGLDRMADGIERCRLAANRFIRNFIFPYILFAA